MPEPVTHLAVDIETLGVKVSTVVLSLACVPFTFEDKELTFDDHVKNGFYVKFSPIEQLKLKRTVDKDTIDWWKSQGEEAFKVTKPSKDDVTIDYGLMLFKQFINSSGYDFNKSFIWCRGQDFDFPKIEDLCRSAGVELPYNKWKARDIRTYIDVLTGDGSGKYNLLGGEPKNFIAHHALYDTALDVARMKEIYHEFFGEE